MADGQGGLAGRDEIITATSPRGRNYTGTYSLGSDCTGSLSLNSTLTGTATIDFVLVNNGNEAEFILSNVGTDHHGVRVKASRERHQLSRL